MATLQNRKRERGDENLQDGRRTKAQKIHAPLLNKRRAKTPPDSSPTWHDPPEFWDRLSTIPLVRSALAELDRRNRDHPALPPPPPPPPSSTRPARDLARFARHGGPDLRDLRGYPAPGTRHHKIASAMSSSPRDASPAIKSTDPTTVTKSKTTKSRKSSTYHRGFEQHLTDHGIHATWDSKEPSLDAVFATLAKPRASLSPSQFSDGEFKKFCNADAQAKDEEDMMRHVIPTIIGTHEANHPSTSSMVFGKLAPLTDGSITAPRPDIAWGALLHQLHPSVRNELQSYIIPSTATDRLMAPNFFIEVKGPDGSAAVMGRQARYDGAVGARAMHSLQNYGEKETIYDGQVYTYSSTYLDGMLKIYAHHTTAPTEGERPEYHMNQVNSYAMTGERQDFVRGATAFRNLRDLAKKHRSALIVEANARYHAGVAAAPGPSTVPATALSDHGSSSDEFVECEAHDNPQDTSRDPGRVQGPAESQSVHSPKSSTCASSLPSGKSHHRGTALSKRNRESQSPLSDPLGPSDSRRHKKHG